MGFSGAGGSHLTGDELMKISFRDVAFVGSVWTYHRGKKKAKLTLFFGELILANSWLS